MSIDGYDPLEGLSVGDTKLFQDVAHRNVVNILRSYTGFYDLFAETIQNGLDAIEARHRQLSNDKTTSYQPTLWIKVDLKDRAVRVADNGIGMTEDQFKVCFAPNVSFKRNQQLRGQKGVGATFLAYGFSFVKLQTKRPNISLAAVLRGGRQWAEDESGHIPRPKLEQVSFDSEELQSEYQVRPLKYDSAMLPAKNQNSLTGRAQPQQLSGSMC